MAARDNKPKNTLHKRIYEWAYSTYPKKLFWKGNYTIGIKAILIFLSLCYLAILTTFITMAPNTFAALIVLGVFVWLGLSPLRGLGASVALAVLQKNNALTGFVNLPLFVICFATTALIWIFRSGLKQESFRRARIDPWVFAFFAISILSTLIHLQAPSLENYETLYSWLMLASLSVSLGFYLLAKQEVLRRKQISPLLKTILITGVIVCILGWCNQIFHLDLFNNDFLKPIKEILGYTLGVDRIMSTFDNPNLLGMYLLYLLPLCFYLAFDENETPKRWFMGVISFFLLYILYLTLDLSSMISLSFGLAIILAINLTRFVKKWIVLAGIIILAVSGIFLLTDFTQRWEGRYNILWPTAIDIGMENFWTGVGPGNYYMHYKEKTDFDYNFAFHSHNLYLQLFAERGIFGILTFLIILGTFFINKIKWLFVYKESNHLTTAMLLAIISTLIVGLMQFSFSWLGLEIHFWLYMLITIGVIENHIRLDI